MPKSILKIKEGFSINLIINFPLGQCQSEDYESWYDENEIKERGKNAGLSKIMEIPTFFWLFLIMTVIWYTFVLKGFCCGKNSVRRLSMIDRIQLPKYFKPASVEEGQTEDHEEPKIFIYIHIIMKLFPNDLSLLTE